MNVILDTNIYYNNYFLNSPKFIGLFDYLSKTDSKLLIPSIVKEELKQKFSEDVEKYILSQKSFEQTLRRKPNFVDGKELIRSFEKNLENSIKQESKIIKAIDLEKIEIPFYEIIKRATAKRPPFNSNGRGFRDSVIWFAVMEIAKTIPKSEKICFISKDKSAFGKPTLKEELLADLESNKLLIEFFNSLEEFLSKHGKKIEFLDDEYVSNFTESGSVWSYVFELIADDVFSKKAECYWTDKYKEYEIKDFDIDFIDIDNFYIYDETEESYFVSVELDIGVSLGIEVVKKITEGFSVSQFTEGEVEFGWIPEHIEMIVDKKTKKPSINKDRAITILR